MAGQLNVNVFTVCGWENDKKTPAVRYLPRIIEFLGYYPFPALQTLGERLLAARRSLGLSRKRMARQLSVDEMTLALWETEKAWPAKKQLCKIETFLAAEGLLEPPMAE